MPRRDIYHDLVVNILVTDGWVITQDPLTLSYGNKDVYADLGAEKTLAAEKGNLKIAVEIKSFLSPSAVYDLEVAIGQYNIYRDILTEIEPDRLPYLAIPDRVYKGIFSDPLGQLVIKRQQLQLLIFNEQKGRLVSWIPLPNIKR